MVIWRPSARPAGTRRGCSASLELERRVLEPFPDIHRESPHRIELEAALAHAMQQDRRVVQAGLRELARCEDALMQVERDALAQHVARGAALDRDPGACA